MEISGRTRPRVVARPRLLPPLLVAALAWPLLTAGFTQLIRSTACVADDGLVGFLASNVALMRPAGICPTGTLGFGPHTPVVLGSLMAVLVWVVLAHVAAAALGMWFCAAARAVAGLLATLLSGRGLPARAARVPSVRRDVVDWLASAVGPRPPARQVRRRGPPAFAS